MEALPPCEARYEEAVDLEDAVSDLHALKKLYGFLQQQQQQQNNNVKAIPHGDDERQDCLDEKSKLMLKKLLDGAAQQVLQCQAKAVSSLDPRREEPRPGPPPVGIQNDPGSSMKLQECHSIVRPERRASQSPSTRATIRPFTKPKQDRAVAEPKIEQKPCTDRERGDLKRQRSQRSTIIPDAHRINRDRNQDHPSRGSSSSRIRRGPRDPVTNEQPRGAMSAQHRATPPVGACSTVNQKRIRVASPQPTVERTNRTLVMGRAEGKPTQTKPNKPADGATDQRGCSQPKPIALKKSAMQPHRTTSRQVEGSRRTGFTDRRVENESKMDVAHENVAQRSKQSQPKVSEKNAIGPGSKVGQSRRTDFSNRKVESETTKEHASPSGRREEILREKPSSHHRDPSICRVDKPHRQPTKQISRQTTCGSGRYVGPYQAKHTLRTPRRLRPTSLSSRSHTTGTDTTPSGSSSSSDWAPQSRHIPGPSLPHRMPSHRLPVPRQVAQATEGIPTPNKPTAHLRNTGEKPHQMLSHRSTVGRGRQNASEKPHQLNCQLTAGHGRRNAGEKPHQMVSHRLGPTRTSVAGDKRADQHQEKPEGRMRRLKNKLSVIFHHHHHHHHHIHPGSPQGAGAGVVSVRQDRHHRSLWEYIRRSLHHSGKETGGKKVASAQHGFLHALVEGLLRHVWGTRQRRAAKAEKRRQLRLGRTASPGGGKKMHWWQWFRRRRGVKLASRKKPRLRLPRTHPRATKNKKS